MTSTTNVASSVFPARRRAGLATAAVFGLGVASWLVLAAIVGDCEAWDSPLYFTLVVPFSIVVGLVAGWRFGGPSWRWPLAFFGGEFAVILALWLTHEVPSLWPLTLAILFALALPCWLAASLVVRVRERVR